jgi:hypothetical protein
MAVLWCLDVLSVGVLIINYMGDGCSSTSFDWCALSLLVPTQLGDPLSLQGFLPLLCAMEGVLVFGARPRTRGYPSWCFWVGRCC